MFPAVDFRIDYAQMEPGDVLYAYTDGVTEARDRDRSFYTDARLLETLAAPTDSAAGLLRRVSRQLQDFMNGADPFDDITMVAVRRAPTGQSGAQA
jgi:serine phosphatase RsbU (regulator of sigma subunit)